MIDYSVLVQARMSSSRFPGKMLAPLAGDPLIKHVLTRLSGAVPKELIRLVTSGDRTDDPLAHYVSSSLGFTVFRGCLDDVTTRFTACLDAHPCEWFVRISGDSPLLDPGLLAWMLEQRAADVDLVTNVAERTFPPGQSVEILRSTAYVASTKQPMTTDDRQHVTLHLYRHPDVRIRSVVSSDASLAKRRMVVDTVEDLRALETIITSHKDWLGGYAAGARIAQTV